MSYVLIVDDDEDARNILTKVVADFGARTEVAADGLEAIGYIRNCVPHLVLLDLMMPGMNGFEVVNTLNRSPATRNIPVIVISAFSVGQEAMLNLPGVAKVFRKADMRIMELQASLSDYLTGA